MLNFIKYINLINDRYVFFKLHQIIKRDYRIFKIKKRVKFVKSKGITTIEVSLQRIFIITII